jgi:hypothetical protein
MNTCVYLCLFSCYDMIFSFGTCVASTHGRAVMSCANSCCKNAPLSLVSSRRSPLMWVFLLGRCAQSTVWSMTACGRHLAGLVSAGGTRGRGLGAGRVQDALRSLPVLVAKLCSHVILALV